MAINDEGEIRDLLGAKRRIAIVGASPNPALEVPASTMASTEP